MIPGCGTRVKLKSGYEASGMNNDGNGNPVSRDTVGEVRHRGRDAAALAALMVVLAALWAATFLFSTRVWGEYRPAEAELQEPPPPTILVPTLSLDEAREIMELAASQGIGPHEPR